MNLSQAAVDQWLNWPPRYWPYPTIRPSSEPGGHGWTSISISTPVCAHEQGRGLGVTPANESDVRALL